MSVDERQRVAEALPAYDVGAELGRGGWGVVFDGHHRQLGRDVAIKQLPAAIGGDAAVRARFATEARLLASLDHPHIVPVFDYVERDDQCLLVMEKLPGGTVWSRFTSSGLVLEEACVVVMATCSSLHFAHQRGILHRDVKPENLLFSATGTLKLTDFGIAKVVGGDEVLATRAGEVLGTPAYIAPEQATGGELGPPTDVYATGVMLYELVSGHLPFSEEGSALAVIYRHVYEQPTPLREVAPEVPAALADVVDKALATDPAERWPSAEAFGVALAEAATSLWGTGWPARAAGVAVMGSSAIFSATERSTPGPGQGAGGAGASSGALRTRPEPEDAGPQQAIRPVGTMRAHVPRALAADAEVVAVRRIVPRPRLPLVRLGLAAALAAGALVLALVGIGPNLSVPAAPLRGLAVDGMAIAGGTGLQAAGIDLANPITVTGVAPGPARSADRLRLGFSEAGITLSSASGAVQPARNGNFSATIDASGGRFVVPGGAVVTAELQAGNANLAGASFVLKRSGSSWLTAPAGVGVLLVLFSLAYAEEALRTLLRARRNLPAAVRLAGSSGLVGLAATILAGVGFGHAISVGGLLASGLLGAAGGLALALAAPRLYARRRYASRRHRRAEAGRS